MKQIQVRITGQGITRYYQRNVAYTGLIPNIGYSKVPSTTSIKIVDGFEIKSEPWMRDMYIEATDISSNTGYAAVTLSDKPRLIFSGKVIRR